MPVATATARFAAAAVIGRARVATDNNRNNNARPPQAGD